MIAFVYLAYSQRTRQEPHTVNARSHKEWIIFQQQQVKNHTAKISFYGIVSMSKGMKPDSCKVQVLQDLQAPINQTELLSF